MVKKSTTLKGAEGPEYEDDTRYRITLSRAIKYRGVTLNPDHTITVRGSVLRTIDPSAVLQATKIWSA